MVQAVSQSKRPQGRTAHPKAGATLARSANRRRTATTLTPPTMIGVGSAAPISSRYSSIHKLQTVLQKQLHDTFFLEYQPALEEAFSLGLIDDADIQKIIQCDNDYERTKAGATLLEQLAVRGNQRLYRIIDDIKTRLIEAGVSSALLEKALKESDFVISFVFNGETKKLEFANANESEPVLYDLAALGDSARAASSLLCAGVQRTFGGYIIDADHSAFFQCPSLTKADRDEWVGILSDCEGLYGCDLKDQHDWLMRAAEKIRAASWYDEVEESFQWRCAAFENGDFFDDPRTKASELDASEAESAIDVIAAVMGDILASAELMAMLESPSEFKALNAPKTEHSDILNTLYSAINNTDIQWPEITCDSYGIPYIHIPQRGEDVCREVVDMLGQAVQSAHEANELIDMYDLSTINEPWEFIQTVIENAFILSALQQYCASVRNQ